MKDNYLRLEMVILVLVGLMAVPAIARNVSAAPVKLPSGIVLDLSQEQVEDIKSQPGVFYGAKRADMLSPGDVVVSLPGELGGGYIYGRPEHLAKGFASVGAIRSTTTAEHLFVKKRSCLGF
ncbi:MAG: hypothetical protein JSU80_14160 [Deltaproteobacteria bacterium]|nr:MAG: hypothetical protein JSU80_14160 [Deltaproteobacteria bacterium]